MKVRTLYMVLETDRPMQEDATKLRGCIGNRFAEYPLLHQHAKTPLLTYPRVQYKVIEGTPAILGIEEGATILKEISGEITELALRTRTYRVVQKVMYEQMVDIEVTRQPVQYRFLSPWLALNSRNYEKFRSIDDWNEKKRLLNAILIGNILSLAKGLGIVIERRLYAHSRLNAMRTQYKGIEMTAFSGELRINARLPDYIGIGKGVSQPKLRMS
ncbi:MAG: CRISPR-associated endonuclease Cas6 [Methanomicrobiales archaeon]|nr:CRISPR-associated endonuclease Cas6 [Methanomicrobiales archaeon]